MLVEAKYILYRIWIDKHMSVYIYVCVCVMGRERERMAVHVVVGILTKYLLSDVFSILHNTYIRQGANFSMKDKKFLEDACSALLRMGRGGELLLRRGTFNTDH